MADDKEIASIDILYLDETGYGPEGDLTRRKWREKCLEKLFAGEDQFNAWQEQCRNLVFDKEKKVRFGLLIKYKDGSSAEVFNSEQPSSTIDFQNVEILNALDLKGYELKHKALFNYAKFLDNLFLYNFIFLEDVAFSNASFSRNVSFARSVFHNEANFQKIYIQGYLSLNDAIFIKRPHFENATFASGANFRQTSFRKGVNFVNAKFLQSKSTSYWNQLNIDFSKAEFLDVAFFQSLTVEGDASFVNTKFTEEVHFSDSVFLGDVTFRDSKFSGDALFNDVDFSKDATFSSVGFLKEALFPNVEFNRRCNFSMINFDGVALFTNATFKSATSFIGTSFNYIPDFRGCKFDATRLEFSKEDYFPHDDFDENAINNISFLKRLADQHGQVDQALEFNAMELRAKRKNRLNELNQFPFKKFIKGDWWSTHATFIYEKASDFGRSFTRPLLLYIVLMVATAVLVLLTSAATYSPALCKDEIALKWGSDLYRANQCANEVNMPMSAYRAAFEYSLYRTSGLIHFADQGKAFAEVNQRLFGQPFEPICVRVFGLLISVSSMVLIFFIALGLRNRYRIK